MSKPNPQQNTQTSTHQMQRHTDDSDYINTIKVADRIVIDFVWYPGARRAELDSSLVQLTPPASPDHLGADITYTWTPNGGRTITRSMKSGRITLPLPPGGYGVLNVFHTEWDVARAAKGEPLPPFSQNGMGAMVRLNTLGYHLRDPGGYTDFQPEEFGAKGERAVLAFQVDYREPAAKTGPTTPLRVRGEIWENTETWSHLKEYNAVRERDASPNVPDYNPTIDDTTNLQNALMEVAG